MGITTIIIIEMRNRQFNKKLPTVFTADNGYHQVMLADGQLLGHVIETTVIDGVSDKTEVIIRMKCNLAKDIDHANSLYDGGEYE